jgi:hypothetical protein
MSAALDFSVEQWLAIGSAALAVTSFVCNWLVVSRQSRMQFESLKTQMDADLLTWANEAVDLLGEAVFVARGRGAYLSEQDVRLQAAVVMRRLSAAADKGRLFFPNLAPRARGADKEGAFRGFRPPVIDALIFAYYRVERMDVRNTEPDQDTADFLIRCRRLLISEVQNAIDPRRRGQTLKRLALSGPKDDPGGFHETAALAEDLEARFPGLMTIKRDAAWVAQMQRSRRKA